jgi:DNA-directed RNA polymerase subunit M/transcription elongation factor TFIIS
MRCPKCETLMIVVKYDDIGPIIKIHWVCQNCQHKTIEEIKK